MYEGMLAETVMMRGYEGDVINAYFARPLGPGPFPGVVLINHMPGWDEWYREAAHRYAYHGYLAISPNIFYRFGHGSPEDVAAKARAAIIDRFKTLDDFPKADRRAGESVDLRDNERVAASNVIERSVKLAALSDGRDLLPK